MQADLYWFLTFWWINLHKKVSSTQIYFNYSINSSLSHQFLSKYWKISTKFNLKQQLIYTIMYTNSSSCIQGLCRWDKSLHSLGNPAESCLQGRLDLTRSVKYTPLSPQLLYSTSLSSYTTVLLHGFITVVLNTGYLWSTEYILLW